MTLKDLLGSSTFNKVALVLWLVSSVFVLILLLRIDSIVHGELYNYGLQFSLNWAVGYWAFVRLIFVCLAVPAVFSVVVLVLGFFSRENGGVRRISLRGLKLGNGKSQTLKESSMLISCPKCKKVFSKPLSMLDFSTGKANLVNVCPYCNHVLGSAEEEKKPEDNVQIVDLNKREVQQR